MTTTIINADRIAAQPIKGALIPECEYLIEGQWWLQFRNGGTFAEYKAMPAAVRFAGRDYVKVGWNSDTFTVTYKHSRYARDTSVMAPLAR
jgi:hypothetical protein